MLGNTMRNMFIANPPLPTFNHPTLELSFVFTFSILLQYISPLHSGVRSTDLKLVALIAAVRSFYRAHDSQLELPSFSYMYDLSFSWHQQ